MANKKETAAPNVSVGADAGQPPNVNNNSIPITRRKTIAKLLKLYLWLNCMILYIRASRL